MDILIGLFGFFVGLFAWAQIIYPLVLVLPRAIKAIKLQRIKTNYLVKVLAPVVISGTILVIGGFLSTTFIVSSLPALAIIIFKTGNPDNKKDLMASYPEVA